MSLQDLLNTQMDLQSIGDLARRGLGWWIDELAAMLPAAWRALLSWRPSLLAEQISPGVWRYWKDGRAIHGAPPRSGGEIPVGLVLPAEAVLLSETPAPRMPSSDLRRMLAFDIERYSPLAPELIHFDMEVIDRDVGDGRQQVLLGIAPRAVAAALVEAARIEGLSPIALGIWGEGETPSLRFDFLPSVLEAAGETPKAQARRYWWIAAITLLVLNFAVLVGRDMADVARLRNSVEAQAPMVNAALELRRRVEAEDRRRADLVAAVQRAEPLRMLNALTEATPPGAWVQHLEWNGQTLHIAGYKRAEVDIASAVRGSEAFINTRTQAPQGTGPLPGPFDLTADARQGVRR